VLEVVDKGREKDTEEIIGEYVPGKVLVVTSVSTVLFKSTTPSRLDGSLATSTSPVRLFPLLGVDRGIELLR
jgi:hypothetical protein